MNEDRKYIRIVSRKGWTLLALAGLAALVGLFYAEEDFRGWHAWHQFKHRWEAKGVNFSRQSVVPPPVPDDQNFALTPVVASSYEAMLDKSGHEINPHNPNVVNRLQISVGDEDKMNAWPQTGNWAKGTETDLLAWQNYYRRLPAQKNGFPVPLEPQRPAQDVLLALSKYDATIKELREAARLPDSRFPLEYDKDNPAMIMLPHLAGLKRCSQVLQLRAIAEVQSGQSNQALADVKLMLRLADSVRTEPILISHLVRIAILNIALQPVYEGLAQHKWSDAQLAELDAELAKLDFVADYRLSMCGELVFFQGGIFDYLRRHPEKLRSLDDYNGNARQPLSARLLAHLAPSGWFYRYQLHCARPMVEFYLPVADTNQETLSPSKVRKADATVMAETRRPNAYNRLEKMLLPGLSGAARRFAYGQASADLAQTAIALERFRLAHGEYPASLDALAPQFIEKVPHDVINGDPLHYRFTDDGRFVLYSVGWNGTDDDGTVVFQKGRTPNVDLNQGDWVWRYPAW
jgi:hypothetical protein